MKTTIFVLATILVCLAITNFGYSQKTDLKGVKSIELNITCQVVLVQGNKPNMEILGNKKAIEDLEVNIHNGKLTIKNKSKRWKQRTEDLLLKIEIADLEYLGIGGVVDMKTVRNLELSDFEMSVSGVGNIEMALTAKSFRLRCSGVGNIEIKGECEDMRLTVSGVGNVNTTKFVANNAKVVNSGVGKVKIHATDNLDARVSGVGSIRYSGNPSLRANASGLGSISRY